MLNIIKEKVGYSILTKKVRTQHRERAFFNFETAKKVGVLFDATHQESYLIAKDFINMVRLKNIEVFGLGYVSSKNALEYFNIREESDYNKGIEFFAITNNNWYCKPNNPNVDTFAATNFDILIDLTIEMHLPMLYVVGMSKAKLKIGKGSSNGLFYDFVINIPKGKKLQFFIEQLKHYLSVMKSEKN